MTEIISNISNDAAAPSFVKPPKPLGFKAYGSTPHLIGSRLGPGDYSLQPKQCELFTGERTRKGDRLIVTEKVDGSCVSVAKKEGRILALQRAGYLASTSPYKLHHAFERWVAKRVALFDAMLSDDERLVAEWLHTAMGTRYEIADPNQLLLGFALFEGQKRLPYDVFAERCDRYGIPKAHLLSDGKGIPISAALELLGPNGHHGAIDGIEGAVWVLESNGEFNGIAKFVTHDKVDGKYMADEMLGKPEVINYVGPDF